MSVTHVPVFGISGKAFSGKSTASRILVEEFGFFEVSYAEPFKHFLANVLDCTVADIDAAKLTQAPNAVVSGRTAYQLLGEAGRQVHPDIWCRVLERTVGRYAHPKTLFRGVVVSDVRRHNEEVTLRSLSSGPCVLMKVVRSEAPTGEFSRHSSEVDVDGVVPDLMLHNRVLAEYEDAVRAVARRLVGGQL